MKCNILAWPKKYRNKNKCIPFPWLFKKQNKQTNPPKKPKKQTTEPLKTFQVTVIPHLFWLINHHPKHSVSHHLLSIPLTPEVHFLDSSCRSSYSHFQLFKVEINSPWKAISTAQHSAALACIGFPASEATQEEESSFKYFCYSWQQLLANFLLRPEFPNDKNKSEHLQIDRFGYIDMYHEHKLSTL